MGSCLGKASMGGVIDPTVTVLSVDFSGISFGGVSINTTLRVDNPNMGTLDGINIRYKIRKMSDGTLLSEGDVPREFKIPQLIQQMLFCQSLLVSLAWGQQVLV
jgi:LEA14-like dessication related protein